MRSVTMPYYVGAGEPEWDEYLTIAENRPGEPPKSLFKYVEPWTAMMTVLPFPETPGPRPEGGTADPAAQWAEKFEQEQTFASELGLWKLSNMTAKCRAGGV